MDIGNSRVKWATGEQLVREQVQYAASSGLTDELISQLAQLERPAQVHIATVLMAERLLPLCDWQLDVWGITPLFAQTREAELGVVNGYRRPAQLGVDRWLGLLAARALSQQPQLVVDCGTATTLDAMDAQGNHLGGLILPGLQLFRHCLQLHTDIPEAEESSDIGGFATDTAAGIASGAMLATTSAIESMLVRLRQRFECEIGCVLTGGFSSQVSRHLESPYTRVPNLILHGLALQAGQKDRQ